MLHLRSRKNGKNRKNTLYSDLGVFTHYSKVVSPCANAIVAQINNLNQLVLLLFGALCYQEKSDANRRCCRSYKMGWRDCTAVSVGFSFDLNACSSAFSAPLPTVSRWYAHGPKINSLWMGGSPVKRMYIWSRLTHKCTCTHTLFIGTHTIDP